MYGTLFLVVAVVEILEQKTCCQVGIWTARDSFFSIIHSLHVTVNLCLYFGRENTVVFVAKSDTGNICDCESGIGS